MRFLGWRGMAGLVALLLSVSVFAEGDGYLVKKRDFRKAVDVIAFLPVVVAEPLTLAPQLAQYIESQIARKLKRKRLQILPGSEFQSLQKTLDEHQADALVSVRIVYVAAEFEKDRAEWDGARQKVQTTDNSLYDLMEEEFSGRIGATSLQLDILDRDQNPLYSRSGGIELVMKRNGKFFERLPADNLLKDEKRLRDALKQAMAKL